MVFSDALFLFLFLPATLLACFVVPARWRNLPLLAASLAFYALGEGPYLAVMLGSISFNYVCGRWVASSETRLPVALAIVGNLGALFLFKYANFLSTTLSDLARGLGLPTWTLAPIHLPIGISFFTFQAMSYVIDVHRKQVEPQKNPLDLALYIALFPQLIAGPIVRYATVAKQIRSRSVSAELFTSGAERFVVGLAKKTMLANPAGERADAIFALSQQELSTPIAWLGITCYTLQIYFDFSGYSDMAIGLGRMFGFSFLENFNHPYIANSLTDFWRRWHISLSTWFRDYLYIPLGGNRVSAGRTYLNLLIVFVLCGFWHGASWNFLIWGLIHGAFLVWERRSPELLKRVPTILRHFYVLLVVMAAWVFFRAETLQESLRFLKVMTVPTSAIDNAQPLAFFIDPHLLVVLAAGALGATPWYKQLLTAVEGRGAWGPLRICGMGLLLLGSGCLVAAGTYNPFIYFRF